MKYEFKDLFKGLYCNVIWIFAYKKYQKFAEIFDICLQKMDRHQDQILNDTRSFHFPSLITTQTFLLKNFRVKTIKSITSGFIRARKSAF